jgi:hypothetical protein
MKTDKCRLCNGSIYEFLDLGNQPLANSYLENVDEQLNSYPLQLCYCHSCGNLQLNEVVDPNIMYKNYLYVSSTPLLFNQHCQDIAKKYSENLNNGDVIVDIACNDGCLLGKFDDKFYKLGVDPAVNLSEIASQKNNVNVYQKFWSEEVAKEALEKTRKAKLIFAQNVFAHVNDLNDFMRGINVLLDDDGKFIVEFPYAKEMFDRNIYDTIYHEHLSYFFITPLIQFFKNHNLYINDIEYFDKIHGGTLRLEISKNETNVHKLKIDAFLSLELKYFSDQTKFQFSQAALQNKNQFIKFIKQNKDLKIGFFGAAAKGNTFLNFVQLENINNQYICFDENPLKWRKFLPGTKILIDNPFNIEEEEFDVLIILTWNFQDEIMQRCREKYNYKGLFLTCFPNFKIY